MSRADSPLRGRMIFLVGAQRSGTNWLQSMLATHPDIVALPSETQLIAVGVRLLENFVQNGAIEAWTTGRAFMERASFADAARDFCDAVLGGAAAALDSSAGYILERSPNHAEHLDLVAELYPDARVIHIVRDGRDVTRSLVAQTWGPNDIAEAARTWQRAVSVARKHGPSMAGYIEVRYEELLADPVATYQKLLAALDLPAPEPVVEAAVAEASIPRNVDRGQPYVGTGKWRSAWSAEQLAVFEAEAGRLLYDELGYARATAGTTPTAHGTPTRKPPMDRRIRQMANAVLARIGSRNVQPTSTEQQQHVGARLSGHEIAGLLARADIEAVKSYLSADALLRVITPEGDKQGRGQAGIDFLAAEVAADGAAGWGQQLRGQVHFAFPMTVVMTRHEQDGVLTDRAVVIRVREQTVTQLVYYRFGTPPSASA